MNNIRCNLLINEIFGFLPHRYPLLLIDRIIILKKFINICVLKNATVNESFFLGHFKNNPIFPGVLIIEIIAQAALMLLFYSFKCHFYKERNFFLAGIKKTFFKKSVIPGDQMIINVSLIKIVFKNFFFNGSVIVKNNIVCKSEIICSF
ncbi:3-hydroxyacyl-ACP dehydratase FabZ [Buchnera aphidicola (Mollitrichosiphum nigrofasciatum)]|uniref:3-hydroxyacyl-ACP dehydratase FabZ n=1 Tax=Buchnera aphidicola TaxID=9 RepID=UPI0031B8649B